MLRLYCLVVASSGHIVFRELLDSLRRFFPGFDCSFQGKLFSIFQLLWHAVLSDKVQGSFFSHYLHKINVEKSVVPTHDYKIK